MKLFGNREENKDRESFVGALQHSRILEGEVRRTYWQDQKQPMKWKRMKGDGGSCHWVWEFFFKEGKISCARWCTDGRVRLRLKMLKQWLQLARGRLLVMLIEAGFSGVWWPRPAWNALRGSGKRGNTDNMSRQHFWEFFYNCREMGWLLVGVQSQGQTPKSFNTIFQRQHLWKRNVNFWELEIIYWLIHADYLIIYGSRVMRHSPGGDTLDCPWLQRPKRPC